MVKVNDVISIKEKSRANDFFKGLAEAYDSLSTPAWITADAQNMSGTITRFPNRDEIDVPVDEQAIVELYSR